MRASWSGYFRVGDITLPVRLYAGTKSTSPHFVQLHAKDLSPVTRTITCQKDGKELHAEDLLRVVESDGKYIEITEEDMQAIGPPEKHIIIRQFSDSDVIDSAYYDKPYYIVPGKGGELAYAILRQAFVQSGKVAVVTYALYEKEHLGVIKARGDVLLLQQLRFTEEIVPRSNIKTLPLPQPSPAYVDVAAKLMERYSAPLYIEDYHNGQQEALGEVIERKTKGLSPKRQPRIASQVTPEDEVISKLRALLADRPIELREAR